MSEKMKIDQKADHIGGNFEWEKPPKCCGMLKDAVDEEKFIFVSNFTSNDENVFYMMPVMSEGYFARNNGITISHCPWCGTKITGRKRYPLKQS